MTENAGDRARGAGFLRIFRLPTRRAAYVFYRNLAVQFALLFGLWILMSGHYDAFHVGAGAACALAVVAVNFRLNKFFFIRDDLCQCAPIRLRRLLVYVPWLLWQIVVASLQVAAVVLNPKMPVNPSFVRFRTKLPTIAARVILANSITLTPGTITVELEDDAFLVHSLIDASHSSILDGTLPGQVARLYDRTPGQVVSRARVLKSRRGN
ncbi:MAG TPA: Na+/H+ antiporter subunit E [Candidatus Desulfaltia sp.]|nr:Na+/H+ antiporter subunit E [Candidatus Desulfaltia sp.]